MLVIGCDRINSRVRQFVAGHGNPAARAGDAHQSAFRCLVNYESAVSALGHLAVTGGIFVGRNASIMIYPIANKKFLNVAAFVKDDQDWPQECKHAATA